MKWLYASLVAVLAVCAPAAAQAFTAAALFDDCHRNGPDRAACLAYLEGYSQGFASNDRLMTAFLRENLTAGHLEVADRAKRVERPAFCADDEMPGEVLRGAFLKWAAAHPDDLQQPAATALFHALAAAFPCSGPPAHPDARQSAARPL